MNKQFCFEVSKRFSLALFLAFGVISPAWATAIYTLNGGTASQSNQTYTSLTTDTDAVYVTGSGTLTLVNPTITTSGNSSNTGTSSQYGLNAGVLVDSGSATISGGSISTSGSGANALFATGSGASITVSNATITTAGGNAHGVDVTYGGSITLNYAAITTSGASSSVLATDFGGGTVKANGGTYTAADSTSGSHSAGIYSTGVIDVSNATLSSAGDNGAVIDVNGSITLTDTKLTGAENGMWVHDTTNQASTGTIVLDGGSVNAKGGDGIQVTGTSANVTAKNGATITASSGNLLDAVSGATVSFTASGENLIGYFVSDSTSSIEASLTNGTTLKGSINSAELTLDSTSKWYVTADSVLTTLFDSASISRGEITNIFGDGYDVYYNASLGGNSYLDGGTYLLADGGELIAEGSTATTSPTPEPSSLTAIAISLVLLGLLRKSAIRLFLD